MARRTGYLTLKVFGISSSKMLSVAATVIKGRPNERRASSLKNEDGLSASG